MLIYLKVNVNLLISMLLCLYGSQKILSSEAELKHLAAKQQNQWKL